MSLRKELLTDQINYPRKVGKLPGKCVKESYKLEYGEDTMEVQRGFMMTKMKCLVLILIFDSDENDEVYHTITIWIAIAL